METNRVHGCGAVVDTTTRCELMVQHNPGCPCKGVGGPQRPGIAQSGLLIEMLKLPSFTSNITTFTVPPRRKLYFYRSHLEENT